MLKVDEVFSIRPKPQDVEPLSGYLMRISKENYFDIKSIFRYISEGFPRVLEENRELHAIDILPERVINLAILSRITKVDIETLKSMTFTPVFSKITVADLKRNGKFYTSLLDSENTYRRFCPKCLEEFGSYKIIWQVKDIQQCDIHYVDLVTRCPKCGAKQPYITDKLAEFRCYKCESLLYSNYQIPKELNEQQQKLYYNWGFLLGTSNVGLYKGLPRDRFLAIQLFYSTQLGDVEFNPKKVVKNIPKQNLYGLMRYIHKKNKPERVTVQRLLRHLDYINMDIADFFNIIVPSEYIESVMSFYEGNNKVIERKNLNKQNRNITVSPTNEQTQLMIDIESYLKLRVQSNNKIYCKDVYTYLGKEPWWIAHYFPSLVNWIRRKVKKYENIRLETWSEQMVVKIKSTINDMGMDNEIINYSSIAKKLGISIMTIKRNKKLIQAILESKQSLDL